MLGQDVPIGSIDAELHKLWLDDETNSRASLTNFAIYSERAESLQDNTAIIEEVTAEVACRALLIHADPTCEEAGAKAWITAHCRIDPRGKKNICSEQITFDLCGPTGDLLRNIVFAHLDSDLPLVLWWQGDLNENFDERLYSRIDRLLVNSDKWDDRANSFAALRQALADTDGRIAVHDLSWTRSYHFRLAIAKLFDDPSALSRLDDLRTVTITHQRGVPIAARMLGAWIKGKLPLQELTFRYVEAGEGANLTKIVIGSSDAEFTVERESHTRFLKTWIECPEKSSETLCPAGPERRSDLITDLMGRAGSNLRYREILKSPHFEFHV